MDERILEELYRMSKLLALSLTRFRPSRQGNFVNKNRL